MAKIALIDGLPAWAGDDLEFVCQWLRKAPLRGWTITEIVREMGLEDRTRSGQPSAAYFRIRAALHGALKQGLVRKLGRLWGSLPKPATARAS